MVVSRKYSEPENPVRFHARPRLRSPDMVAAWPGIGNVAIIVASYLKKKLHFKRLGEINAPRFFSPNGVLVKNNVVEAPQFPESRFYYWKNRDGGNDLILFIGEDQPLTKEYELANTVLDAALKFNAGRIYTCAAALTRIHHTEQSRVWAVATSPHVAEDLRKYDLIKGGNMHIAGLNGLLLGVAKERGLEGVCLLGEVPSYATRVPNPMAALAVLEGLSMVLGIDLDLTEMMQLASEAREKMKQVVAEAMGEYISNFTEPIWESGDEGADEEDEEEN